MEQLVLTMSDVRFPAMRREVVRALASLADIDYQRRAWVGGEFSEPTVYEDLTMNINVLFDDCYLTPRNVLERCYSLATKCRRLPLSARCWTRFSIVWGRLERMCT